MTPARSTNGGDRGFIIPVGGAEEKTLHRTILKQFTELCGGEQARIAVIPTASRHEDTGPNYEALFDELGVERVWNHPFETRSDCRSPEALAELESATGIFLSGGNQLRLSTTLGGTPVARAIRRLSASGVHVAGTSAGAAFLPEHMIAFGDEGSTPRADMVTLAPGLGLTNHVVVDQHFRERDRLGRLITALAYNPFAIGVGLDEDTAAFIGPDDVLHVAGSGAITIVDPTDVEYSSMDSARRYDPVSVLGLRVHILTDGASYDIGRRVPTPAPAPAGPEESHEVKVKPKP